MALFKRKQAEVKTEVAAPVAPKASGAASRTHVLTKPRITEKATMYAGQNAYVFNVSPMATKREIEQAVFAVYNVKPRMIRIVSVKSKIKRNSRTGKMGMKQGGKKAYVFLKQGETIAIA